MLINLAKDKHNSTKEVVKHGLLLVSIVSFAVLATIYVNTYVNEKPTLITLPNNITEYSKPKDPELKQQEYYKVIKQTRAALARTLSINKSCFDIHTNIWFVHSIIAETEDNKWTTGWYYCDMDDIETITLGNETLMVTNTVNIFNNKVYPDLTKLLCETHASHK